MRETRKEMIEDLTHWIDEIETKKDQTMSKDELKKYLNIIEEAEHRIEKLKDRVFDDMEEIEVA